MRAILTVLALASALVFGFVVGSRGRPVPATDFSAAAVSGQKGGQDIFGAYDVAANWPKPLTDLPDHQKWTYSAFESIYAESPNRVLWGVHGFSVDQEGNVYIAEVDNGRVQKYRPRPGANPA